MSTNPADMKDSGCCDSAKPNPQKTQQLAKQTPTDDKAQKAIIPPPEKPTTPQPKSKSCCG